MEFVIINLQYFPGSVRTLQIESEIMFTNNRKTVLKIEKCTGKVRFPRYPTDLVQLFLQICDFAIHSVYLPFGYGDHCLATHDLVHDWLVTDGLGRFRKLQRRITHVSLITLNPFLHQCYICEKKNTCWYLGMHVFVM